jgi:hypothetical protein
MSQANKPQRHYWEMPLGVIRGYLEEPGPLFVDPYASDERRAIQEIEREEEKRIIIRATSKIQHKK